MVRTPAERVLMVLPGQGTKTVRRAGHDAGLSSFEARCAVAALATAGFAEVVPGAGTARNPKEESLVLVTATGRERQVALLLESLNGPQEVRHATRHD